MKPEPNLAASSLTRYPGIAATTPRWTQPAKPRARRIEDPPQVIIRFNESVLTDISILCRLCPVEIGWMGLVHTDKLPSGVTRYTVYDIYVPSQECSATVTRIDPSAVQREMLKYLHDAGRADEEENIRYWGHSHVDMATSPSGQDEREFEDFYKCGYDYFIRGIHNRANSHHLTMYVADTAGAWVLEEVPLQRSLTDDCVAESYWQSVIDAKVTDVSWTYAPARIPPQPAFAGVASAEFADDHMTRLFHRADTLDDEMDPLPTPPKSNAYANVVAGDDDEDEDEEGYYADDDEEEDYEELYAPATEPAPSRPLSALERAIHIQRCRGINPANPKEDGTHADKPLAP